MAAMKMPLVNTSVGGSTPAPGTIGMPLAVGARRSRFSEEVYKTLGPTAVLAPTQSVNLDMRQGPVHSTTGIPYAIGGTATVVSQKVGLWLSSFDDPIKAILGVGVHKDEKIIIKRKYCVGGGATIVPERAPARTVAIQEDVREVTLTRYGGDIEMNLNLFLTNEAEEEMEMKIDCQKRELERQLVKLGYDCLMREGTLLTDAIMRSSPVYNPADNLNNHNKYASQAFQIYSTKIFGAINKFRFPVANLLAAAKYASAYSIASQKGSVMILPHGVPELTTIARKEKMEYNVSGLHDSQKITMQLDGAFTDPNSGVRILVHHPTPSYRNGAANPTLNVAEANLTDTSHVITKHQRPFGVSSSGLDSNAPGAEVAGALRNTIHGLASEHFNHLDVTTASDKDCRLCAHFVGDSLYGLAYSNDQQNEGFLTAMAGFVDTTWQNQNTFPTAATANPAGITECPADRVAAWTAMSRPQVDLESSASLVDTIMTNGLDYDAGVVGNLHLTEAAVRLAIDGSISMQTHLENMVHGFLELDDMAKKFKAGSFGTPAHAHDLLRRAMKVYLAFQPYNHRDFDRKDVFDGTAAGYTLIDAVTNNEALATTHIYLVGLVGKLVLHKSTLRMSQTDIQNIGIAMYITSGFHTDEQLSDTHTGSGMHNWVDRITQCKEKIQGIVSFCLMMLQVYCGTDEPQTIPDACGFMLQAPADASVVTYADQHISESMQSLGAYDIAANPVRTVTATDARQRAVVEAFVKSKTGYAGVRLADIENGGIKDTYGVVTIRIAKVIASSAILGAPGDGTGQLLIGYPFTGVSTSATEERMRVQLRCYLGAALYQPDAVLILPNVFVDGIANCKYYTFTNSVFADQLEAIMYAMNMRSPPFNTRADAASWYSTKINTGARPVGGNAGIFCNAIDQLYDLWKTNQLPVFPQDNSGNRVTIPAGSLYDSRGTKIVENQSEFGDLDDKRDYIGLHGVPQAYERGRF